MDKGIEYLEEALELDPDYAPALVALSQAHAWRGDALTDLERTREFERAHTVLDRAAAIAPDLAEVHAQRAWLFNVWDMDWKRSYESIRRALALDSGSPVVLRVAGVITRAAGRNEESADYFRRQLELDPLAAIGYQNLAHVLALAGKHEEAILAVRRALELSPERPGCRAMLAYCLMKFGRMDEALAEAGRDSHEAFRLHALSLVSWKMGRKEESDRWLKELIENFDGVAGSQIAELYAVRGNVNESFAWIDRAIADRDGGIMEAAGSPEYDALHSDPRWLVFRKRMNYAD